MNISLIDKFYVAANNTASIPCLQPTATIMDWPRQFTVNKVINGKVSVYASYRQGTRHRWHRAFTPLAGKVNGIEAGEGTQFEIGTKGALLDDKLVYEGGIVRCQIRQ